MLTPQNQFTILVALSNMKDDLEPEAVKIVETVEKNLAAMMTNYAQLLSSLEIAERELTWLDKNALIKSRAGGDYIEVEHLDQIRATLKRAKE